MADIPVTVTPGSSGAPPPASTPTTTPSPLETASAAPPVNPATPTPAATPPATPPATEKAPDAPAKSALEEGSDGETAPPATPVVEIPEIYKSIKAPEGFKLDTPTWKAVSPVFAKAGIKAEQAQEIVDAFAKAESARAAEEAKVNAATITNARAECARIFKQEDYSAAKRAITKSFKDPALVQFMTSQLGNHPDFIAGMAKIGRAMLDDGTPGTRGGEQASDPDSVKNFAKQAGWTK